MFNTVWVFFQRFQPSFFRNVPVFCLVALESFFPG